MSNINVYKITVLTLLFLVAGIILFSFNSSYSNTIRIPLLAIEFVNVPSGYTYTQEELENWSIGTLSNNNLELFKFFPLFGIDPIIAYDLTESQRIKQISETDVYRHVNDSGELTYIVNSKYTPFVVFITNIGNENELISLLLNMRFLEI